MRQRQTFRGAALESLEGRQLLSATPGVTAALRHRISHVAGQLHAQVHGHGRAAVLATGAQLQTTGAVTTGSTQVVGAGTPQAHRAGGRAGRISIPENTAATTAGLPTGASQSPVQTGANPFAAIGARGMNPNSGPLSYTRVVRGLMPTQFPAAAPVASQPVATSVNNTLTHSTPTLTAATPAAASQSPTSGFAFAAPAVAPSQAPPAAWLGGLKLSPADVAGLKSAVDKYAAADTYGKDAAKDQAALADLKAGLDDVALGMFSETHVASKDAVANLQKAVASFGQSYTSGANAAADRTAWGGLQGALGAFTGSLKDPAAPAPAPTPPTSTLPTADHPIANPTDPADMPMMPPGPGSMPLMHPGLAGFAGPLFNGPPLTPDEVTRLKAAVDDYAGSDTYGADPARDKQALAALQAGLSGVIASHEQDFTTTAVASGQPLPDPAVFRMRHGGTFTPTTAPVSVTPIDPATEDPAGLSSHAAAATTTSAAPTSAAPTGKG